MKFRMESLKAAFNLKVRMLIKHVYFTIVLAIFKILRKL